VKASLVPPPFPSELRDLTRQRLQLIAESARETQRIQKVLEDANIKLASVATDVMGMSGRDMLRALIAGETNAKRLAELARGRLKATIPALQKALVGRVTDHHRFMLRMHLDHYEQLEALVAEFGKRITEKLAPIAPQVQLLRTIPGIQERTAQVLLAETGPDLTPFPTAAHLASWAGVCSGNNESAGKRRIGRTRKGGRRAGTLRACWQASADELMRRGVIQDFDVSAWGPSSTRCHPLVAPRRRSSTGRDP
jgi:transposase